MPASWIAAGVGVYNAVKGSKTPSGSAGAADPFAGERPQYQEALKKLMTGDFTPTDPSYKWRLDQGLEATNRTLAASGLLNSGNRIAALSDYAQNQASTEYANQFTRLARLAGADVGSPSSAAQLQTQQNAGGSAFVQQAAGAVKDWWNSDSSSSTKNWFSNTFGGGGSTGSSASGGGTSGIAGAFGGEY